MLLVRSVTRVDQALLAGSKVRFVGTCTIGVDHLDIDYLQEQGIGYASAPGCNANSVVEYVFSALARLRPQWLSLSFGVVGCGNVGGALVRRLKSLGLSVKFYDPLIDLAERDDLDSHDQGTLEDILQADVVCLHAPLTRSGNHPSWHLLGAKELNQLKPGALLLNAGRGPVLDNQALLDFLPQRPDINVVLDVWEPEPDIDVRLLPLVDLATPHIAGYSYDGKVAGTSMIYRSLCDFLGVTAQVSAGDLLQGTDGHWTLGCDMKLQQAINQSILQGYDVTSDDQRMREAVSDCDLVGSTFDRLRKEYPQRREFFVNRVSMAEGMASEVAQKLRQALTVLGFSVV